MDLLRPVLVFLRGTTSEQAGMLYDIVEPVVIHRNENYRESLRETLYVCL